MYFFRKQKINQVRAITTMKREIKNGNCTTKRTHLKCTPSKASTGVNSAGISSGASLHRVLSVTVSLEVLNNWLSASFNEIVFL